MDSSGRVFWTPQKKAVAKRKLRVLICCWGRNNGRMGGLSQGLVRGVSALLIVVEKDPSAKGRGKGDRIDADATVRKPAHILLARMYLGGRKAQHGLSRGKTVAGETGRTASRRRGDPYPSQLRFLAVDATFLPRGQLRCCSTRDSIARGFHESPTNLKFRGPGDRQKSSVRRRAENQSRIDFSDWLAPDREQERGFPRCLFRKIEIRRIGLGQGDQPESPLGFRLESD